MFFFTFLEKRRQHKYCLCEVNLVSSCKYLIWWAKGYICLEKQQFKTLVASSPIFVADTKIIFGYNFVAPPFKNNKVIIKFSFKLRHFFLCVTLCHVILRLKTIKARSMNKIKKRTNIRVVYTKEKKTSERTTCSVIFGSNYWKWDIFNKLP